MEHVIEVTGNDSQLAEALDAVRRGEHVTLVRDGVPCATVEPIKRKRKLGIYDGLARSNSLEALLEPMSEEDLDAWEDSSIFPNHAPTA